MQVDDTIQNKQSPMESENSAMKQNGCGDSKQVRAQNRIARYEQKPERKASKMLVRLLQWADKLVIKFFTKKLLPNELEIFFNREARANKVELKKAQIDYSVEDFAVRLYVFWVCQNYFQKSSYEQNLAKLLLELRDQLNRKKKNLAESFQMCEEQTQKRQKQEELKWMSAIITGLNNFIFKYTTLHSEDDTLQFLLDITRNIMIDCLRKPGNKLGKKNDKLKVKIKYFQQKISQILGNPQIKTTFHTQEKKPTKLIQKNTIIISPGLLSIEGLTRTNSNSSAFQKYKAEQQTNPLRQVVKKQDFQVKLEYPKWSQSLKMQQNNTENQQKSQQKLQVEQKPLPQTSPTSEAKMEEEVSSNSELEHHSSSQ